MMGLSSSRALFNASSPQGYQSTGLSLCWSRYGLVSFASLLATASRLPKRRLATNPNVSWIGVRYFSWSAFQLVSLLAEDRSRGCRVGRCLARRDAGRQDRDRET